MVKKYEKITLLNLPIHLKVSDILILTNMPEKLIWLIVEQYEVSKNTIVVFCSISSLKWGKTYNPI